MPTSFVIPTILCVLGAIALGFVTRDPLHVGLLLFASWLLLPERIVRLRRAQKPEQESATPEPPDFGGFGRN